MNNYSISERYYKKEINQISLLSEDQVKVLITEAQNGNPLSRDKVLLNYQYLLLSIANKYIYHNNDKIELMDLVQIGNLALNKAIDKYDPSFMNKFSTFAYQLIRNAIINEIRSYRINYEPYIDSDYPDYNTPDLVFILQEKKHQIIRLLDVLPKKDKDIIKMRFGLCQYDEHTLDQIAKKLNVSKSRVSQIISHAFDYLRHTIETNLELKNQLLSYK